MEKEKSIELGLDMNPSCNGLERKRIHLSGGETRCRNSDYIISISRNNNVTNPRIKIIRNKFTPSK